MNPKTIQNEVGGALSDRAAHPGSLRRTRTGLFRLFTVLSAVAIFAGCTDDRKAPTQTGEPAYSQTFVLLNHKAAAGTELTATFTVRDTITSGRLLLSGFIRPDPAMQWYLDLGTELDSIADRLLSLEGMILNLEVKQNKTPEDLHAIDSLMGVKAGTETEKTARLTTQDSLDTRLDDRFKVAVWLDGDAAELYPRAIYLDSTAAPAHLHSGERVVWGQGYYLAQEDTGGVYGKTMQLDLRRMMVADATYQNPTKPARPANPDLLPELFPVTDWLTRLNPGTHTIHFRFASPGTATELSASLYVVFKTTD